MPRMLSVAVLGACLGLCATAGLRLALAAKSTTPPMEAAPPTSSTNAAAPNELCRNIFDASGSLCQPPAAPPGTPAQVQPTPCDELPRLVATWVVASHPERSRALFMGTGKPVSPGAMVGVRRLARVDARGARLVDDDGAACEQRLFVDALSSPTASPPKAELELRGDEIRLSGDLVAELVAHPEAHLGAARLVPGPHGATVYGVRRGDLLDRAGLRNGDVLESVEGVPLSSNDALVGAVAEALARGQLSVRIRRRGHVLERRLRFPPGAGVHPSA